MEMQARFSREKSENAPEVSEKTMSDELQREFTQKINDRLQNCGIELLSKLTAESMLSLPEIVQTIN